MVRSIGKGRVLAVVAVHGTGAGRMQWSPRTRGPLSAMVFPAIPPTVQEIPNPLRGQYEDLLIPLFPQGNPAQQRYPAWPASYDASLRVSWRQLQPTDPRSLPPDAPDDRRFDFSVIDDALTKLAEPQHAVDPSRVRLQLLLQRLLSRQHQYRDPRLDAVGGHQLSGAAEQPHARGDAGGTELERPELFERLRGVARRAGPPLRRRRAAQRLRVLRVRGFQREPHRVLA